MSSLTIVIPMGIPPELSPNWQYKGPGQNGIKSRAITQFKEAVFLYAVDARNKYFWFTLGQAWQPLERATIQVTIVLPPRARAWDADNTIAGLKTAIDAIVRADIIVDDGPEHLTWLPIKWERGSEAEIRIEIKELAT